MTDPFANVDAPLIIKSYVSFDFKFPIHLNWEHQRPIYVVGTFFSNHQNGGDPKSGPGVPDQGSHVNDV